MLFINHHHISYDVENKYEKSNTKHYYFHYDLFLNCEKFCLDCFKTKDSDKIDGTQIPTNIPSNSFPVNHKVTENKKDIKARMTAW